ncbi:hypothetical protein C1I36_10720 [Dehalobacter sp. 14DCB1]|nr:hypothetical protein C1I36_10720 [Dehalobacter sp. 14DCB1]
MSILLGGILMRSRKLIIMTLIAFLGLLFPVQAFADTVTTLDFNKIESLMNARNPMISENMSTYTNAVNGKTQGIAAMDALLAQWSAVNAAYGGGTGVNPQYEAAISYLLAAQKAALDQQKSSYTSINTTNTLLNIEKGNNTLIWSMEMLYISYNAIGYQLDDLMVKKSLAERQVKILKLQQKLGMVTQLTVDEAENSLLALESAVQNLKEAKESILQQFNLNLNQDYDCVLTVNDVPNVMKDQIAGIDVQKDYLDAKGKSYDYILDSYSLDSERKFKNNFYRAYQTVLDKQQALDVETKKMTTAESKWKIAQLKYKLGMISEIQFETERSTYMSQQTTTEIAKDTVMQAYRQYEWAKRGLIVSSSTGA